MSNCCPPQKAPEKTSSESCCGNTGPSKKCPDYLLWCSATVVVLAYLTNLFFGQNDAMPMWLVHITQGVFELVNRMWWGIVAAVFFVGLLERVPRELVMSALGRGGSKRGVVRATIAGVLLDLCSHGILMIGTKLYERGASLGQLMAFLIASPWNSLSLTIIMLALIGWQWTLLFIVLSMLIGVLTGFLFDGLVARGKLPENPHAIETHEPQPIVAGVFKLLKQAKWTPAALGSLLWDGLRDSRMVFRWLLFGIVLAVLIRAFVPMDTYQELFGPTVAGLFLTLLAATIIEVCSEGSTPIAADLLTRAGAPGNSFAFLMAGVSTDYTEVMVIKDTTRSWRVALFLPLLTVPQILIVGWILNQVNF